MILNKMLKIVVIGIIMIISFCPLTKCNQEVNYISYKSDFYSLIINNETYYGHEKYNLFLNIEIINRNNVENFSIELILNNIEDSNDIFILSRNYFYNRLERTLLDIDKKKIGVIPIFIEDGYQNNDDVLLAEFNNESLMGKYQIYDGNYVLSGKGYPYNIVLTDATWGDYTDYFYSEVGNLLICWNIGNDYDLTLDKLLNLTFFYGDIELVSTSFNIEPNSSMSPYLLAIIIAGPISIFLIIFFFVRRSLIKREQNK